MTRLCTFLFVLNTLATPAVAQTLQPPAHWEWITDGPARMVTDLDVFEGAVGPFSLDAEVFGDSQR